MAEELLNHAIIVRKGGDQEQTCLSRCVETEHEEAHFFGFEELVELFHHFGELAAHGCCSLATRVGRMYLFDG